MGTFRRIVVTNRALLRDSDIKRQGDVLLGFGLYTEHEKLAALQAATQALLKQIGFIAADGYLTFSVVGDPLTRMCSQQSWQVSSPGGTGLPNRRGYGLLQGAFQLVNCFGCRRCLRK